MNPSARIKRDVEILFGQSEPEVVRVCLAIIEYIDKQTNPERLHLTYSLLQERTKPVDDESLMLALQYLAGARAKVLEMNFEFVDEDGDYHALTRKDVADAKARRSLPHPVTGQLLSDFEDHVLVYFKPTCSAVIAPKRQG